MFKRLRADEDIVSKINSKFIDEPFQGSKKMTPKLQAEIMAQVSIQCGNMGSDYLKNATKDAASGALVIDADYLAKVVPPSLDDVVGTSEADIKNAMQNASAT